jgi:hypothetical protein
MPLTAIALNRRAHLTGSAWILALMAGFAVADSLLKATAQSLPIIAGSALVVASGLFTLWRGQRK